ncbi:LVIVD repeat-containing protein [Niabella hirudinis]|uniref:LVIVD repeat-containing protein n=1 Tax=Niabella hirudinis TaxID=1285929 RepID=UPI003EBE5C4A
MKLKQCFMFVPLILLFCTGCKKGDTASSPGSGAGGSTARMTISGDYLYLVSRSSLQTYDISNPAQMLLLSTQNVGWNIETIFPYRDKLFIGSETGMYVFDNSNPKKPQLQGQAQHLRSCDPVVADENYAYVTLRSNNNGCGGTLNQLNIYDIQGTRILSPKQVSSLPMSEPQGLGLKDNILYVCMGTNGLNVVDVADKTQPVSRKIVSDGTDFIDVIPYDHILIVYAAGGFLLYDITNPADPKKIANH